MPVAPDNKSFKIGLDRDGPKLGFVRLLAKTPFGFVLRPTADIEAEIIAAFGTSVDCSGLSDGLTLVCRSLNEGDLAKAAISLRFLPLLSARGDAGPIAKASPDDPVRPGWPAGTPDSQGGQFRPKTASEVTAQRTETEKNIVHRRSVRSILKRILSTKRLLRLLGENAAAALTEEIPGVDVALTAEAVKDDLALLKEIGSDLSDAAPAIELADKAPVDIQDLQVSPNTQGFESFDAFKKIELDKQFGPAGDGLDYHHLVEQGPNAGILPQSQLQSTENIVKIPRLLHEEVNSFYARPQDFGGELMTPRQFLKGRSFEDQRDYGIDALRQLGAVK